MSGEIRPVAVTGIGIQSPIGFTSERHWAGIIEGWRAVRFLDGKILPDTGQASEGWSSWSGAPVASPIHRQEVHGLAILSSEAARIQAQLVPDGGRVGVVFGASKPVLSEQAERPIAEWWDPTADRDPARFFAIAEPARAIATVNNATGPLLTPSAACATGLLSIIRGADLIRDGACDVVIAGSADSSLHPAYLAAYRRMGVLAPPGDDPGQSCRPFDARRNGFAVGEGAAALVLEDIDHARNRGATILAELLGAGLTSDNDSLVDVDPSGQSLARALSDALNRSGVTPGDIDAASLHGTGTRLNDICETNALKKVCGEHAKRISCFSLKGAIGHLMGAAGSVETATLIQAMQHGVVPPTVNLEEPDPECDLDYTPGRPRSRPINVAVKLSLGFGGTCAALVIRRPASA